MKTIYIVCPAYVKTGGTELLHQLAFWLNKSSINCKIAYRDGSKQKNINPAFFEYISDYVLLEDVIKEDSWFILPEIYTDLLKMINPAKCIVWWESVNNYHTTFLQNKHETYLLRSCKRSFRSFFSSKRARFSLLKKARFHLVQSEYAKDYLNKHGINGNVYYLKDYLNAKYFEDFDINTPGLKKDIIVYNPKKGAKVTKRIIRNNPDYHFIPLINMTNDQVYDLLKSAKVYIDFGSHPGMDRIPREAAMLHCCVITNKCGSAAFFEDVPIDEKYKFDDSHLEYQRLRKTIQDCFSNYQSNDSEYNSYRDFIRNQFALFQKDYESFFLKTLEQE